MKTVKFIIVGLSFSLAACQSSTNSQHTTDSVANTKQEKSTDKRFLIVPGISIGEISLGEDMQEVGRKFGKPNAGDAAMGKAWSIWYSKDSTGNSRNELAIYSAYRDTSMRVKEVKQIRITSDAFKTQDGLSTGENLKDARLKFTDLEKISAYLNEKKDTVLVFDAVRNGIGFEFLNGKIISLTVHPINKSLNATYLTLHPEWKLIQ